MPILNYGRPDNWELIPSLTKGEIFIFRQYIFDAKKKFKYKDDKLFLKTIEPNWDYTNPYIYLYDSIQSSFARSVHQGRQQYAASRANAYSSSSGRGFGGGFSSGGGFGGGGGGGHGF